MDLGEWNDWWKHFGISPVKHILLLYWDPIGIYGEKAAHDEYDMYVGGVGSLLAKGAEEHQVADYLFNMEHERMGLGSGRTTNAAYRVSQWFDDAMKRIGEDPRHPVSSR